MIDDDLFGSKASEQGDLFPNPTTASNALPEEPIKLSETFRLQMIECQGDRQFSDIPLNDKFFQLHALFQMALAREQKE